VYHVLEDMGFFVIGNMKIDIPCLYCDFHGTLGELSKHKKECKGRKIRIDSSD